MPLQTDEGPELLTGPLIRTDPKYRLTSLALWLILISILVIFLLIFAKSFEASDAMQKMPMVAYTDSTGVHASDSLNQYRLEVIKAVHEEKKDYREFFLKICQMILLNLLLPILTAILGYKVGSAGNDE